METYQHDFTWRGHDIEVRYYWTGKNGTLIILLDGTVAVDIGWMDWVRPEDLEALATSELEEALQYPDWVRSLDELHEFVNSSPMMSVIDPKSLPNYGGSPVDGALSWDGERVLTLADGQYKLVPR